MIELTIPGYKRIQIKHLVLDLNGTIACDGKIIIGVRECLKTLADKVQIHILTADTFGKAESHLRVISFTQFSGSSVNRLGIYEEIDILYNNIL